MTRQVKIGLLVGGHGVVQKMYKSYSEAQKAAKNGYWTRYLNPVEATLELPDDVFIGERDFKQATKVTDDE